MAITEAELESLIQRDSGPDGHILSVYLDVDQSKAANLNRGFLTALTERLRDCEHQLDSQDFKRKFRVCADRVLAAASKDDPRGRALVFFCDPAFNFFFERELRVPLDRTEVRWDRKPYARPLVEIFDEYERYGIVLVNREHARLFTVWLGEIEEHREIFSEHRKRFKQTAKDNVMSSLNLQRHEDEHVHQHLKEVAEALDTLASKKTFDRLILAGPHEIAKALQGRLSKRLQELLIRSIALPIDASEREVLDTVIKIREDAERQGEKIIVDQLITAAAKDSQATIGLQQALDALRLGSILRLVYVHDYRQPGKQCTNCDSLFAGDIEACLYCGGRVVAVDDIVARLVEQVVDAGGGAESVRGEAAERLRQAGNIGAFLRFRSGVGGGL